MCCLLLQLSLPAFVSKTGGGSEENKTHFFAGGRPAEPSGEHLTQEEKLVDMIDLNQEEKSEADAPGSCKG